VGEVDGATPVIGERGMVTRLDAFEGRRMLIAYYFTPEGRVIGRLENRQIRPPIMLSSCLRISNR
jgi:hypothetical protein